MSVTQGSELVGFDADAALEAARNAVEGGIHLCVEYTEAEFRVLHADRLTMSLYGDEEEMTDHFQEVHSYVNIDFTEMDLFEDLMVAAGQVRAFVTYMDEVVLVRVLGPGREGLFLTLDTETPVSPVVEAVEEVVEEA